MKPYPIRSLLRWFVLLALLLPVRMVWSQDLVLSRGLLVDASGEMTIDQVAQSRFKPIDRMVVEGYTSAVTWLKIEVQATTTPLVLRVLPTFLDHLTLYWRDPQSATGWLRQSSGDQVAMNDRPLPFLSFAFPIDPNRQTTYFLRLQTSSSSMLIVNALSFQDALRAEWNAQVPQVIYYSLMLCILLWAISDFLIHRQLVVGLFILLQTAQILFNLAGAGYLAYAFPRWTISDMVFSSLVILLVPLALVFHRVLLAPFSPHRFALRLTELSILAGPILLVTLWTGAAQQALIINAAVTAFMPILLLYLVFSAGRDHILRRSTLRLVYVILAISVWVLVLPLLGIFEAFGGYVNSRMLQGLVAALLMASVLFVRSQKLQRQSQRTSIDLARTEQHLADQQRRYVDQTRFLDMLTHELKTPVGVIRITTDTVSMSTSQRDRINRAIETISDVIERCRFATQVDHEQMKPVFAAVNLSELMMAVALSTLEPARIQGSFDKAVTVTTDPHLLKMVLQNLLDNALKYSPTGTIVTLALKTNHSSGRPNEQVQIDVANALPPGAKPEPTEIFKKYYRGVGSIGISGTGLGLYLVDQIVDLVGGSIVCQVQDNRIVFSVLLPQHPAA